MIRLVKLIVSCCAVCLADLLCALLLCCAVLRALLLSCAVLLCPQGDPNIHLHGHFGGTDGSC